MPTISNGSAERNVTQLRLVAIVGVAERTILLVSRRVTAVVEGSRDATIWKVAVNEL